jgi:hypothetical protein
MPGRILLVDYENIRAVDLPSLPADVKVSFVLGGKQGSLPTHWRWTRKGWEIGLPM